MQGKQHQNPLDKALQEKQLGNKFLNQQHQNLRQAPPESHRLQKAHFQEAHKQEQLLQVLLQAV